MRRLLCLVPLVFAAACQPSTSGNDAAAAPAAQAPGNDYLARVAALPAGQRQMVLFRAIRDAGQDCQDVDRVEPQPADAEGRALWRVTCRGGGQFAVGIDRFGTATVQAPRAD